MRRERSWRLTRNGSAQMNLEVRFFVQTAVLVAATGNGERDVPYAKNASRYPSAARAQEQFS